MANSGTVTAGSAALASQYNNLRDDVLNVSTGHTHTGASENGAQVEGTALKATGITDGFGLFADGSGGVAWEAVATDGVSTTGYSGYAFGATTALATYPRWATNNAETNTAMGWDNISLTRLIAPYDFTVTNIAFVCSSRARSGTPTIRFGIYTRSGTTFTLVARTASDSSIFAATETKYTRALDTTGGYPATYSLTSGSEYWVGLIVYNATVFPYILLGQTNASNPGRVATGNELYRVTSQTDLAGTATGTANTQIAGLYAELT